MSAEFDIVIRGGTVIDGSGAEPFAADIAVKDGKIVAVGSVPGQGSEEISAVGRIVTPGFVDIHTHYDGQITWENRLAPSSQHGVTTVLMGNCGVGFAPCKPEHQMRIFFATMAGTLYPLGDRPDYEPNPEERIDARAARLGVSPGELAYDLMLEQDGRAIFLLPAVNFVGCTLEPVRAMIEHPDTLIGLGDGGAHYGFICDSSFPTTLLAYWTRDREKGPRLPLARAVHALSRANALAVGMTDRGLLAAGMKADINIIDYDRLTLHAPRVVTDLPAGGKRMIQDADGYDTTIVSGVVTYRGGVHTGALPGRLVRGRVVN